MGHSMSKGIGLSGTSACDHKKWCAGEPARSTVLHGLPLLMVEGFEVGGCRLHLSVPKMV